MKYNVLNKCVLTIEKGSIVELDSKQSAIALSLGLIEPIKAQEKKKKKTEKKEV